MKVQCADHENCMGINMAVQYNCGVAIATYNGENFIAEQLNSILNQTVKPDLIVVSDGGSDDNTVAVCEDILSGSGVAYKLLTSDGRLSIKDNFEKCISFCEADYIFISDQDDVWRDTKIEDYLSLVYQYHPSMIFSNALLVNENLESKGKTLWDSINYHVRNDVTVYQPNDYRYYSELFKHNIVTGMCMMIDRRYLSSIVPFSSYAIHDTWISNVIGFYGTIIAYNKCEVLYRQHNNNVIGTTTSLKKSYAHRDQYLSKLKNKICLVKDVLAKCTSDDIKGQYKKYLDFLVYRKKIINGNCHAVSIIKYGKKYKQYCSDWKIIILKDLYTRVRKKDI